MTSRGTEIFFSLLITFVFAWLSIVPPSFFETALSRFENVAYDLRLSLLLPHYAKPTNPIAIVDVDEKSIRQEGRWPWPREKMAQLVQKLYAQGATVIAFDMLFSEPQQSYQYGPQDEDKMFADALRQGDGKIVLGTFLSNEHEISIGQLPPPAVQLVPLNLTDLSLPSRLSYISNIPLFENIAGHGGVLSITPDSDGILRRYSLLQRYGNNLYPSLALEAVKLYFLEKNISINIDNIGDEKLMSAINLGNHRLQTDSEGRVYIPYIGPPHTFTYYSASDILNNKLPPNQLKNKIIFVGTSAVGLGDVRATPVGAVYPGVEIHATVANGLFSNHFPYIPLWMPGARLSLIVILGIILSGVFAYRGPFSISIMTVLLIGGMFEAGTWLWQHENIIFPLMLPILLVLTLGIFSIAYGFSLENQRRNKLKQVFEQYVPSARVNEIIKNPEAAEAFEGERKVMSVLFMDIRNFTGISEKLSISELKKLLNFFLTEMTSVIFNHGGTIDKYVGDMVMAFWGAPLPDIQHARHSIEAGLDMLKLTNNLQEKLIQMNLPRIHIGIGVNTGVMNVGDMGSMYRRAYTVLGDAVNLASRLESLTKYYGVDMIVGESTIQGQDEFVFKLLDKVTVKGKNTAIAIYEPLGLRLAATPETIAELAEHTNAIQAYFGQHWLQAKQLFSELEHKYPECIVYRIYRERISHFEQVPPPQDWDGVWEHLEK